MTHVSAPPQRRNSNLLVTLSAAAKTGCFFSPPSLSHTHPCSGVCVNAWLYGESDLQISSLISDVELKGTRSACLLSNAQALLGKHPEGGKENLGKWRRVRACHLPHTPFTSSLPHLSQFRTCDSSYSRFLLVFPSVLLRFSSLSSSSHPSSFVLPASFWSSHLLVWLLLSLFLQRLPTHSSFFFCLPAR